MSDEETPEVVTRAEGAYEAIRALNHLTSYLPKGVPAPTVYEILGNLKGVGHMLPQTFNQLAAGLGKSLNAYEVYEDDGRDPVQSVAAATDHLTRAAQLAAQVGQELEQAQSTISRQGYRDE